MEEYSQGNAIVARTKQDKDNATGSCIDLSFVYFYTTFPIRRNYAGAALAVS